MKATEPVRGGDHICKPNGSWASLEILIETGPRNLGAAGLSTLEVEEVADSQKSQSLLFVEGAPRGRGSYLGKSRGLLT